MKRLMKFLFGFALGATVAVLLAPKSGRELREQLIGGATGRLLTAAPDEYPQPEGSHEWEPSIATAVAEPAVEEPAEVEGPAEVEEPPFVAEPAAEEAAPEPEPEPVVEAPALVVEAPAPVPVPVLVVEEAPPAAAGEAPAPAAEAEEPPAGEDLRARIEETRATVEADIAQPFAVEETAVETPAEDLFAEVDTEAGALVAGAAEGTPAEAEEAVPAEAPPVAAIWSDDEPAAGTAELVTDTSSSAQPTGVEGPDEQPTAEVVDVFDAEAPTVTVEPPPTLEAPAQEPEAPAAEEPQVEQEPSGPEPVSEEQPTAVAEPVVAEAPIAGPPPAAEPAAAAPTQPAPYEGGLIDQAEMRRRIEETRARLKAKAFDAMMSGEAALLARDSGEKPVPTGGDVKLDGDVESTIDESLSQEDY